MGDFDLRTWRAAASAGGESTSTDGAGPIISPASIPYSVFKGVQGQARGRVIQNWLVGRWRIFTVLPAGVVFAIA